MPKGGARTRSGPPPDPQALSRERDGGDWTELPAEGRSGRAPGLPLPKPTQRERSLWKRLWSMPQAVMWEAQSQELEVALYVRRLAEAEQRGSPTNLSTLVRQMADSLGLTTPGLLRNRWRIVSAAEKKSEKPQRATSSRDRLTVVRDAG